MILCLTIAGLSIPQDASPDPPNDFTKIYYATGDNKLLALPFESGITSMNVFAPALEDKITRVRLNGSKAETVLTNEKLSFFVFVADRMDPPPHQLVRLTRSRSERSLKISLIKGRKGYAPFEEDNVQLGRRILKRLRVEAGKNRFLFINYMELRPLASLPPGEYAIIGDSLADIATFRIE
ncbi:MAG TPA: hypothetical protein DC054_01115 [Blastocatellia bacterium]|nr:hypothetical protein [Blastocatellia bacterium]